MGRWSSLATLARSVQHVALRLPGRALLRVDGSDAARYLQGLASNNVLALSNDRADAPAFTALLNHQVGAAAPRRMARGHGGRTWRKQAERTESREGETTETERERAQREHREWTWRAAREREQEERERERERAEQSRAQSTEHRAQSREQRKRAKKAEKAERAERRTHRQRARTMHEKCVWRARTVNAHGERTRKERIESALEERA